ncbi:aminotransferase class IV [Thermoflavimicrobium daqui]|nr:aminotransferase class IV [Thermoflavimicrobium daqui]
MTIMIFNGSPTQEAEAAVSIWDHGLLYGVGAFETFRVYDNHLFLIDDHMDRLDRALKRMMIRNPFTRLEWENQIQEALRQNGIQNGTVRLCVTGGVEGLGLHTAYYHQPTTMIFVRPLPFYPNQLFQEGKKLQVVSIPRQANREITAFKSNNFLNFVLARQEVEGFPKTEGLLLTEDNYLAEGIVSNLFFISKGKICTPSLELGILPGITRKWLLHLAKEKGYPTEEGYYTLSDLDRADEIFMTNSVQEMIPIYSWQDQQKRRSSSIVQELYQAYQEYTKKLRSVDQFVRGE